MKLFVEGLENLLVGLNPADVPNRAGRYSREWFASRIGCATATLTSSTALRRMLGDWERDNPAPADFGKLAGLESNAADNVVVFSSRVADASIWRVPVLVKTRQLIVPTLIWDDEGFDDWVGDYARYLVVERKQTPQSVEETIKDLRVVRRAQRKRSLEYHEINDGFLLELQSEFANAGVSPRQSDGYIIALHDFLKWAESKGRLKNQVQVASKHDYPEDMADYPFPVTSEQVQVTGRHGKTYMKWVSPLLIRGGHSTYGTRHTPTGDEIEELLRQIDLHSRNIGRDKLIVSCPFMSGARVSEMVQLYQSDFPTPDTVMGLFDEGMPPYLEVKVVRKNRGKSNLRIPLDLVLMIVDYLYNDEQRKQVIRDLGLEGQNNLPLFISEKTGKALTTDSITRICGFFFRKARIKKANIHRLRARYITEVIEYQLDLLAERGMDVDPTTNWQETILTMAVQLMGQGHRISLQPYLNEILVRRTTAEGKIEPRSVEAREKALGEIQKQMAGRFKAYKVLSDAERLLAEGNYEAAAGILERVLDSIRNRRAG
ncbi:hypothetical protein GFB56_15505 [Ensifer sp. T173]|uniref:Tyr recombinase domain-containing protein n=1 Tax=Ensifer canadensis TaxID=555315 RepID=A0AAW4FMY0_9HYPH|nr:site-specific integrase [Ensifer canadensis]MBM3092212.1 hypothetical protein [Ensifer canadensis]UBI73937.1 site-specific integrase [Ensifer canadensis]